MTLTTSTDQTVPVTVQTRSTLGPQDAFRLNVPILQQAKGGTDLETVKSADGTIIACERDGDGPALMVSVGALRTRQAFVAPCDLTQRFTVVTCDRRGRGDSGDTGPFAPERSPVPAAGGA